MAEAREDPEIGPRCCINRLSLQLSLRIYCIEDWHFPSKTFHWPSPPNAHFFSCFIVLASTRDKLHKHNTLH